MDANQKTLETKVYTVMNVIQEKTKATINTYQEEMTTEIKASQTIRNKNWPGRN
jgi:hypothetical protein